MPYIKSKNGRREKLQKGNPAKNAGELNYQIFHFIKYNVRSLGLDHSYILIYVCSFVQKFLGEKPNYQKYNDVTGVLIRCSKEIKRRLNLDVEKLFKSILDSYDEEINNYEDLKIYENGDV